jgi:hypothetical protein
MYYEEKIIDGRLYWRNSPDGLWRPVPEDELTEKYIDTKNQFKWYVVYGNKLESENRRLQEALKDCKLLASATFPKDAAMARNIKDIYTIAGEALKENSDDY